jgi:radical SAM/Cys-rich protein
MNCSEIINNHEPDINAFDIVSSFRRTLEDHRLSLVRNHTTILQINTGLLCNQNCRHCHLNAGPDRKERMNQKVIDQVVAYARRCRFETIDITGGAPELNPHLPELIEKISTLAPKIMVRSNLSALHDGTKDHLLELFKRYKVIIVASFPAVNESQTDAQRGKGVFKRSLDALNKLNELGYGGEESDLELDLVSNPTGAFLPPSQDQAEKRFKQLMAGKYGISFNSLFNFANVPIGRFRDWLRKSGNLEGYLKRLADNFNPCAIDNVMCRMLVSVDWGGYLYDCDFNLARGIPLGGQKTHVSEMPGPPEPASRIAVADHCYSCTAGTGFT